MLKAGSIALSMLLVIGAQAHQGHHHDEMPSAATPVANTQNLAKINSEYIEHVKPIFTSKCFDCHSNKTKYPWYSNMPIAKGLIKKDIEESKDHLDFSDDFPFKGHGTDQEDLLAIRDSISKGRMPPFRYRFMHPGSSVTENEKTIIYKWIDESLKNL